MVVRTRTRGPGTGHDGSVSLRPERVDEAHRLGVRLPARLLVQPVAGGGVQMRRLRGQGVDEQGCPTGVGGGGR